MHKKVRRARVDVNNFFGKALPKEIEKDLLDDEQICEVCGGIGLIIKDYPFYIRQHEMHRRMSKYNKPHVKECPACYNGVQQICEFCGKPKAKFRNYCGCEGYQKYEAEIKQKKIDEWYEKAEKITLKEAAQRDMMLYDEYSHDYFTVDDIYGGLPEEKYGEARKWMFGTSKVTLSDNLDAYYILENATESLHEEALDSIDEEDISELQDFLKKWANKQACCNTYYDNHKVVVLINIGEE